MKTVLLNKIEHFPTTLRDLVQDRVREAIIDGTLRPGQRLVERTLCEQLGVSRSVVRETIRYLEAEGLVENASGRGPTVVEMSWEDARQIYDIRRALESSAAYVCAQKISKARKQSLKTSIDALQANLQERNPSAVFRAANVFYSEIFEGAGHHVALEIVQRLNGRIGRLRMMTLSDTGRARPGPSHMQAIYEAIVSGHAKEAETAVHHHLDDAMHVAERLFMEANATENNIKISLNTEQLSANNTQQTDCIAGVSSVS